MLALSRQQHQQQQQQQSSHLAGDVMDVDSGDTELQRAIEASMTTAAANSGLGVRGFSIDPRAGRNPDYLTRKPELPVGLWNAGNTCWANSIIQVCGACASRLRQPITHRFTRHH